MILIRRAQIPGHAPAQADLLIDGPRITRIAANLPIPPAPCRVIEANGAALLPGLWDHHIHLFAAAAARSSIDCAPPLTRDGLTARLMAATASPWIRGVNYHESVAGDLDRHAIDAMRSDAPVRLQHRSGRLWIFNSAALAILAAQPGADVLERQAGRLTGRLYDGDAWLSTTLRGTPPNLAALSAELAAHGIIGVTDTGAQNNAETANLLAAAQARGELTQALLIMGHDGTDPTLGPAITRQTALPVAAIKLHLHDNALPDPDAIIARIRAAHATGLPFAVHAVSEADLIFILACFDAAGTIPGDRLEHASITPRSTLAEIARHKLTIVTQPHFIAERGDAYGVSFSQADHETLYRLQSFRDHGIPLAAGSDAPYGGLNPWAAMDAARARRARDGLILGPREALTTNAARDLYLGPPHQPGTPRHITADGPADLILLDRPWPDAAQHPNHAPVRLTLCQGRILHERPAP